MNNYCTQYKLEVEEEARKDIDSFHTDLSDSLITGFINQHHVYTQEYLPKLVLNNKKSGQSVLAAIHQELKNCDEFWISVAFLTMGGVAVLINLLKELEQKGVQGKIVVSQYQNFTQPQALRKLLEFNNIQLKIVIEGNFHAKSYISKTGEKYSLIIGSSNLTDKALRENKEWNLKLSSTGNGKLIIDTLKEFSKEFDEAQIVDAAFIDEYEKIFAFQKRVENFKQNVLNNLKRREIRPNLMQKEALENLKIIRAENKDKALLISATGTGKTYLSAFDVKEVNPDKFLFIVHRANIAKKAMESYGMILGNTKNLGMYSGDKKQIDADYIFSTIQTLSMDINLNQFDKQQFDYIVIDESHRAGAPTYQKILKYFKPKFLLGMTATPERMDGYDIFKEFDYNIAYEIRLHRALEEKILCDFHYFGVADITVDGKLVEEDDSFKRLMAGERINNIITKAQLYGCDNVPIRGLVFCNSVEESNCLSDNFNCKGYKTVSLSGKTSENDRAHFISKLESDKEDRLDYIFTVDIFNEGIDIPKVNQIIMLRPTQSAIIFVQQLGRGLRKAKNKEYVTIIDFIGNYKKSYLIPIALYGNTTYNKDTLRKLMISGSSLISGVSTINFDKVARERIFESIDKANMQTKRDLVSDYKLLKYKIGRIPMMVDFLIHGSRDPWLYAQYAKSYYNFVVDQEDMKNSLDNKAVKFLELFSNEIANTKRVEEVIILKELLKHERVNIENINKIVLKKYEFLISDKTLQSCIKNMNFEFITETENKKLVSVRKKYKFNIIKYENSEFLFEDDMKNLLDNNIFKRFFADMLEYSLKGYDKFFDKDKYIDGFVLYRKYSRKDVFRILNWDKNPVAQNVGGYIISKDKSNCPIFVNYHKDENISDTTKYTDGFISKYEFEWMSKSNRTINSPDIQTICNYGDRLRIPLFIKKSNAESSDFYYMGDVALNDESVEQTTMPSDDKVSVVKMVFTMKNPVEDSTYEYLTKVND